MDQIYKAHIGTSLELSWNYMDQTYNAHYEPTWSWVGVHEENTGTAPSKMARKTLRETTEPLSIDVKTHSLGSCEKLTG